MAAAPTSWRPAEREAWTELPEGIKREVHRREGEFNRALTRLQGDSQIGQAFANAVQPYQQLLAVEGAANPIQAVEQLLRSAATLRMGSQQQKAAVLADFVKSYDVDLATFDQVLSNTITGQPAQSGLAPDIASLIDERMAPVNQMMQMFQQSAQGATAQRQQAADSQISAFEGDPESPKPYFNDVRMQMADLIDLADKQNRAMTLDEAYDIACRVNPQVAPLYTQQQNAPAQPQRAAQKRKAASMLSGTPGGDANAAAAASRTGGLRADLERAWDSASAGDNDRI